VSEVWCGMVRLLSLRAACAFERVMGGRGWTRIVEVVCVAAHFSTVTGH
jgi:hypothetical protein